MARRLQPKRQAVRHRRSHAVGREKHQRDRAEVGRLPVQFAGVQREAGDGHHHAHQHRRHPAGVLDGPAASRQPKPRRDHHQEHRKKPVAAYKGSPLFRC